MRPTDRSTLAELVSRGPDWLESHRREAYAHYEKLGMPSERDEVWRYVELDFDIADLSLPAGPGEALGPDSHVDALAPGAAGRATVIDGYTTAAEADDVVLTGLAQAWTDREELVRGAFGSGVPADLDVFAAAHAAFVADGVFVYVPAKTVVPGPIVVDVQAVTEGVLSLPHVTVVVEDDAELSMVVVCRSPAGLQHVAVPQIEASVRDGARFRLTVVQDWSYDARAIAQCRMVAGRDVSLRFAEAGLGARFGRLHLTVDLMGRGADAAVSGLYFGEHDQLLDYRAFINHLAPNTTSDMFLKGAVEDEAHAVFTGLIRIAKDAQRTNAFQTNRNLVLSDGAGAWSVPNLEILANDVRCGHGSTVGPLDDEQRYYLMTRGLPQERADRLQVRGFFEQVLKRFPQPELMEPLRDEVNAKFIAAQEEGRL